MKNYRLILAMLILTFAMAGLANAQVLTLVTGSVISGTAQNVTVNLTLFPSNLSQTNMTLNVATDTPAGAQTEVIRIQNTSANQRYYIFSVNTVGNASMDRKVTLNATARFDNGTYIASYETTGLIINNTVLAITAEAPTNNYISKAASNLFNCTTNEEVLAMNLLINGRTLAMSGNSTGTEWSYTTKNTEVPDGNYVWTCSASELSGGALLSGNTQLKLNAEQSRSPATQAVQVQGAAQAASNNNMVVILGAGIVVFLIYLNRKNKGA